MSWPQNKICGILLVLYFYYMPTHTLTNPALKQIIKRADEAYMDYLKKMKVLEKRARELFEKIEAEKKAAIRGKIKKLK